MTPAELWVAERISERYGIDLGRTLLAFLDLAFEVAWIDRSLHNIRFWFMHTAERMRLAWTSGPCSGLQYISLLVKGVYAETYLFVRPFPESGQCLLNLY